MRGPPLDGVVGFWHTLFMRTGMAVAALVAAIAASLTGCSAASTPASRSLTFDHVIDETHSSWYTVDSTAHGDAGDSGATLTIGVVISNANETKFSPQASIEYADGSSEVCKFDDPRQVPSLVESTTSVDIPCTDGLTGKAKGATVTITDAYG